MVRGERLGGRGRARARLAGGPPAAPPAAAPRSAAAALARPRRAGSAAPAGAAPPVSPLPADALYGRLLASAAQHVLGAGPPPRARLRLADGRLEPLPLDRWLAPADATDIAVLAGVEAPVLDLGCGPGRHLAALRAAGKRGLGRRSLAGRGPARARARRGGDQRLAVVAGASRRHVADDPAARRQHRHRRRADRCCCAAPANCSPPVARSSSRPTHPARRRSACASGSRRPGWCRSGSAGRASAATASPRSPRGPGSRSRRSARCPAARSRRYAAGDAVALAATPRRRTAPRRPPASAGASSAGRLAFVGRAAPGSLPAGVLPLAAARAVADQRAGLDPARADRDRRPDRLPLARRLPPEPARQRDRARRPRPAVPRLAGRPVVAVRAHAGAAHERRAGRDPVPAGEAVVGDPAAVRVAAGQKPGAGDRAALDRAAGRERGVRARDRRDQRAVLVPVQVQLRGRALLRRDRVRRVAGAARDRQDAGGDPRLSRARRAQAAARQPREHEARARGRAGLARPGGADDLAPRPARLRRCGRGDAAGRQRRPVDRRAAAQAGVPRARAARTSRSTRPQPRPAWTCG